MEAQRVVWNHEKPGGSTCEHAKPKGKWKEVSAEIEAIGGNCERKEKTRGNKIGRKGAKREADLYTMLVSAAHR